MKIKFVLSIISIFLLSNCNKKVNSTSLVKDCPEEKIINKMPTIGDNNTPNEYFIYKGQRKEINEFDSEWIKSHCTIKETIVY